MKKYQGKEFTTNLQANTEAELDALITGLNKYAKQHNIESVQILQKKRDPDGGWEAVVKAHNWNPIQWVKEKFKEKGEKAKEGKGRMDSLFWEALASEKYPSGREAYKAAPAHIKEEWKQQLKDSLSPEEIKFHKYEFEASFKARMGAAEAGVETKEKGKWKGDWIPPQAADPAHDIPYKPGHYEYRRLPEETLSPAELQAKTAVQKEQLAVLKELERERRPAYKAVKTMGKVAERAAGATALGMGAAAQSVQFGPRAIRRGATTLGPQYPHEMYTAPRSLVPGTPLAEPSRAPVRAASLIPGGSTRAGSLMFPGSPMSVGPGRIDSPRGISPATPLPRLPMPSLSGLRRLTLPAAGRLFGMSGVR